MKKLLSIALLVVMVLSMAIIPSAAADIDVTGRKNICLDASIFAHYDRLRSPGLTRCSTASSTVLRQTAT